MDHKIGSKTFREPDHKAKENPKKAQLFQDTCDLLRPVTLLYGDCPRLALQLQCVSNWETVETFVLSIHNRIQGCLHIRSQALTFQVLTSRVYRKVSSAFQRKVLHKYLVYQQTDGK